KGKFNGTAAWSGNGRYLVLGNEGSGLSVYENVLTPAERARGLVWWKEVQPAVEARLAGPPAGDFLPVPALGKFTVREPSRKEVAALFARALAEGRTQRSPRWDEYPGYVGELARRQAALEAARLAAQKGESGIAIFRIRAALKKQPGLVPL